MVSHCRRRRLVAAVCSVLFACGSVHADDKPPAEPEKFAVIHLVGIDANELVRIAQKLGHTKIVRMPLSNAVLVWGTGEEVADMQRMLRPL